MFYFKYSKFSFAKGQFEVVAKTTLPHGQNYELTKLQDGRILISEFAQLNSSLDDPIPEEKRFLKLFEIYNPKTKKFEKISQPKIWHYYYTKPIVLDDGKVIMAGKPEDVLMHQKEMIDLKLDIPFALKAVNELKKQGIQIKDTITIEGLVEEICRLK